MSSSKLDDPITTGFPDEAPVTPGELPVFELYDSLAGGCGAPQAAAKAPREQSMVAKAARRCCRSTSSTAKGAGVRGRTWFWSDRNENRTRNVVRNVRHELRPSFQRSNEQ
jgi:hypothetical protein